MKQPSSVREGFQSVAQAPAPESECSMGRLVRLDGRADVQQVIVTNRVRINLSHCQNRIYGSSISSEAIPFAWKSTPVVGLSAMADG
jgi:hypothetical protein